MVSILVFYTDVLSQQSSYFTLKMLFIMNKNENSNKKSVYLYVYACINVTLGRKETGNCLEFFPEKNLLLCHRPASQPAVSAKPCRDTNRADFI